MRVTFKPKFRISKPITSSPLAPRTLRLIAVASLAASLYLIYIGLNPSPTDHSPVVPFSLALVCIVASLRTIELSGGDAGPGNGYGFLAFTGFSIMAWTMALDKTSECTIGGLFAFLIPQSACRPIFIVGAALFSLAPLFFGWQFVSEKLGDSSTEL